MLRGRTFHPIQDRILARMRPREERSEGGVLIPDQHQDPEYIADVIAVGPGRWVKKRFERTSVRPGDTIFLRKRSVQILEKRPDGAHLVVLKEHDHVAGIIE